MLVRWLAITTVVFACGCSLLPDVGYQPTLHNPFPQLSKVAIAPFFNHSSEPTLDGHQFALAYYNELQAVPGYEVLPVDVVEEAMRQNRIELTGPADARRLAQLLGADAIVIGAVTDYSPYYPPRCGLHVEWYAANACFHPIPPGYGLPWGTPDEEQIPPELVFEAELALAREQLKTQTPVAQAEAEQTEKIPAADPARLGKGNSGSSFAAAEEAGPRGEFGSGGRGNAAGLQMAWAKGPAWPDPTGLIPPPPSALPPSCSPSAAPVLTHTRIYHGNDADVTEALANYYFFRDDARFGGWQSYLDRSEDFIRFCCRMHIWEMLSARGGAGPARVVWRWPVFR